MYLHTAGSSRSVPPAQFIVVRTINKVKRKLTDELGGLGEGGVGGGQRKIEQKTENKNKDKLYLRSTQREGGHTRTPDD